MYLYHIPLCFCCTTAQVVPSDGTTSVSLWDTLDPGALQQWLNENLGGDCTTQLHEVSCRNRCTARLYMPHSRYWIHRTQPASIAKAKTTCRLIVLHNITSLTASEPSSCVCDCVQAAMLQSTPGGFETVVQYPAIAGAGRLYIWPVSGASTDESCREGVCSCRCCLLQKEGTTGVHASSCVNTVWLSCAVELRCITYTTMQQTMHAGIRHHKTSQSNPAESV